MISVYPNWRPLTQDNFHRLINWTLNHRPHRPVFLWKKNIHRASQSHIGQNLKWWQHLAKYTKTYYMASSQTFLWVPEAFMAGDRRRKGKEGERHKGFSKIVNTCYEAHALLNMQFAPTKNTHNTRTWVSTQVALLRQIRKQGQSGKGTFLEGALFPRQAI